jgi:hypothetical protein
MTLLRYRLRPVPWVPLVGLSAAWLVAAGLVAPASGQITLFYLIQSNGLLIGLGASFLVSSEVDGAEPILQASPIPFWRTPAQRLALWLTIGTLALLAVAWLRRNTLGLSAAHLWQGAVPDLILVAGLCFLGASLAGSYIGGGASLAAVVVMAMAGRTFPSFPIRVLDLPPDPSFTLRQVHVWNAGRVCTVVAGALLLAVALARLRWKAARTERSVRSGDE